MNKKQIARKIAEIWHDDPGYAHVLLHSLAHIYNHTPHLVRAGRLEKFRGRWPALVADCLRTCSQTGRH